MVSDESCSTTTMESGWFKSTENIGEKSEWSDVSMCSNLTLPGVWVILNSAFKIVELNVSRSMITRIELFFMLNPFFNQLHSFALEQLYRR